MSIMEMFSNAFTGAKNTPENTTQNTTQNTPEEPNQTTAPNGVVPPKTPEDQTKQTGEPTPFDQFSDLWNTDNKSTDAPQGMFAGVDPKKFVEAAGKVNFAQAITPEQLQAISEGGEGAVKAFASAMNSVAQTTYAQSAYAATKIVERALAQGKDNLLSELPQHIKKHTVSENLRTENPVFQNPAVQPIISALESQLTVKFPNASAGEITQMAKQYVEALGTSFAPKPQEQKKTTAPGAREETDWSEFLMM